ncbi:iron-containing alcohol dehydrogenase [Spirochaeta cellobiosiphila]|uniref:iron-containing alcohol dehydrogenase n=1 Tax=Spirochaeta cellobiosiphila TaxID=504483 RepID=UPI0004244B7A|nr:iron-containing alcohol dehydrogenase [Spirochaeta cellobiosiphila]
MNNFQYYAPTEVVFGKDTEKHVGESIKKYGGTKVLVLYGGGSVVRSGLLGKIKASLDSSDLSYCELGGVVPNPVLSKVYEGIELCKDQGVDYLLAIGGGSVFDTAKAIGYGVTNEGDVWDFYAKKRTPQGCLPIGGVLTIAAAGSEMSNSSVITKEEGQLKRGCNSDYSRCQFVIMNPELTYTVPPYQTSAGTVDIMMHTLERYFSPGLSMDITDRIAEGLLKTVIHYGKALIDNPQDYNARAEILWASSLSHNGLTGCGVSGDWACHQLEHELSGMFGVTHGAGLAAIWSSWARYVYKENPQRFVQLGTNVFGLPLNLSNPEAGALDAIKAMEDFFHSINMPISIKEMDIEIRDDQIKELTQKCSFDKTRTIGTFKVLQTQDMEAIYRLASQ